MFDPPITSGANLFVIIAVCLVAAGAAIVTIDIYKSAILSKKKKAEKE